MSHTFLLFGMESVMRLKNPRADRRSQNLDEFVILKTVRKPCGGGKQSNPDSVRALGLEAWGPAARPGQLSS